MDLTFRTLGAWGAGKGANLLPSEVDNNFWQLAQEIVTLSASPALPVGIANITVSGTQMTITLTDGTVLGPFTLPVLTFRWRYEWQPSTSYAVLDVFTVSQTGIFMVEIAHTSGTTFDPNLTIGGLPALLMLFGAVDASLSGLSDVRLTSLADQDFLRWIAADAKWENIALGSMAYQSSAGVVITGGHITGMATPVSPLDVATKAYVDSIPAGATAADATLMGNISGMVGPAVPHTLSAFLDYVLATTTRGTLLYRGATGWLALAPGTAGLFLQTAGPGADPTWQVGASGVTSVAAGTGISTGAGPITAAGTVSLAAVADGDLLANISGGSAAPAALTLSQFLDHVLTTARGSLLTRTASGWVALAPGTSGLYLQSSGAGLDLAWNAPAGSGTVTSVAAGAGISTGAGPITSTGTVALATVATGTALANTSGSTAAPVPVSLSLLFDAVLGTTQGAVAYRGASAWTALAPGTSGQFLQTNGAAANPSWASAAGAAPIAGSQLLANLTAGSALALGHTLSDILDYVVSSSHGELLYRGASGWIGLAPGVAGQVLSTGGVAGDPSWIASGATGLIARHVYTANVASYTPTAGTSFIVVTMVSGGGAGGGAQATTGSHVAQGAGGGSSGAVQRTITSGFSGTAITVGAGGVAASGANGGNGTASSFGTLTAAVGLGGSVGVAGTAGAIGGAGGAPTGGDLNLPGARGWTASLSLLGGNGVSGRGGDAPLGLGFGGEEVQGSVAGIAGYGYGAGGSGAINGTGQAARAGGNGAPGLVIIDEYGAGGVAPPSAVTSITAAGTNQATATAVMSTQCYVAGSSGTNGVRIDTSLMVAGTELIVANEGSAALLVYPPTGATINSLAANAPINIAADATAMFAVKSSTVLRSVP